MSTVQNITTAEQLLAAGDIGRCELIQGQLLMRAWVTMDAGAIAAKMGFRIDEFTCGNGVVLSAAGFWIKRNPDTVRSPNIAWIDSSRAPTTSFPGYFEDAPDLAVEVLTPDDTAMYMDEKIAEWLAAGCRLVWVISPRGQTVMAYRPDRTARLLNAADTLDGGEVLPGLRIPVKQIFQ